MENPEETKQAKLFEAPSDGNSGLYIYRTGVLGASLKKDIWVDGDCVGESAPDVFFYTEVSGDEEHVISTESEFSPNELTLRTESGENYFIQQYIKMGAFVGGADLELVSDKQGKAAVSGLDMAKKGRCSS